MVEGTQAGAGKLTILAKDTGKVIGILGSAGDTIALPAGAEYVVEFTRADRTFHRNLRVQDDRGEYVEYLAKIPFLDNPAPEWSFKDKHVESPLSQATDEVILRRIEDAIATEDGNLIIRQDDLCPPEATPPER